MQKIKQNISNSSVSVLFHLSFKCCLIYKTIITLICNLYFAYLCPCLCLGLFMLYLCDLFSIFLSLIMQPHLNRRTCFFSKNISNYFWMITLIDKANNFQIAKVRLLRQILLFLQNNISAVKKLLTVLPRSCFAVTKFSHVIVSAYPSEIEN